MADLQAVVMAAGRGSRITELTAGCPKYLLPVGNLPMVYYPLFALKNAGFTEVIMVVPESSKQKSEEISSCLQDLGLKIDFVPISTENDWGTADSLRHIGKKISKDVLVLSCDLITDADIHLLVNMYRVYDSDLTALFAPYPETLKNASVPGQKGKSKLERDLIGLEPKTSRLIFFNSEADFEEEVPLSKNVLKRHPMIQFYSHLIDAHAYILKKWVVSYVCSDDNIAAVKGELVPLLTKVQFKKPPSTDGEIPQNNNSIFSFIPVDENKQCIYNMSSWSDHFGNLDESFHKDKIKCYGFVMEDCFCIRTNTLLGYIEANRQSHQLKKTFPQISHHGRPDSDTVLGEGVQFGEKITIKQSVIGKHCKIGSKVKIFGSVLMDDVTVEDGCTIQNCIVCSEVTVEEGSDLKDSIVGHKKVVGKSSKLNKEVLGGLLEI